MPTLPDWAEGGRIIWDNEHGLVFIRQGLRRSPWRAYLRSEDGYVPMEPSRTGTNLERLRKLVLETIGQEIENFAMALHPGATYTHLKTVEKYGSNSWERRDAHACGISYSHFETANSPTEVTCPTCLAVLAEDLKLKAIQIGPEKFEETREHVRTVRAFNAFGRVVGEDPAASF